MSSPMSETKLPERVHVVKHSLITHKIDYIRNTDVGTNEFRAMVGEIAELLCYEAARDLPLEEIRIETPICATTGHALSGKKLVVVPILRAGLGMAEGVLKLIPAAKVGHIGLYRDPETKRPVEYYNKLPPQCEDREAFVVDPMLATGGSAIDAITALKEHGCQRIRFLCVIAAPEGIAALTAAHPDVDVYIGAVDQCLNEQAYIVPGLGDAGDRIFGTK